MTSQIMYLLRKLDKKDFLTSQIITQTLIKSKILRMTSFLSYINQYSATKLITSEANVMRTPTYMSTFKLRFCYPEYQNLDS